MTGQTLCSGYLGAVGLAGRRGIRTESTDCAAELGEACMGSAGLYCISMALLLLVREAIVVMVILFGVVGVGGGVVGMLGRMRSQEWELDVETSEAEGV